MVCKAKGCNNPEEARFQYCKEHLCQKFKKNKERCKNQRLKNSIYCFSHQYVYRRLSILGIISLILAIIAIIWGPDIYYFFNGNLNIDFREDSIFTDNQGKPYVKIEVTNELGYTLENIKGTATLNCLGGYERKSQIFELEGGYNMLTSGGKSTYLISPDPLFVDLIKTRDYTCADVIFYRSHYEKLNESDAKLSSIESFLFFEDNGSIIRKTYENIEESPVDYVCIICNVMVNINSANIRRTFKNLWKNPFSENGAHKFVGWSSRPPIIEETMPYSSPVLYPSFDHVHRIRAPLVKTDDRSICKRIKKEYDSGVNCDIRVDYTEYTMAPPFEDGGL